MLLINVQILNRDGTLFRSFTMNHDSQTERRVLGEQCRYAFEAGQAVTTTPKR